MYRFLLSPRWLGWLAAALALATVMSLLGLWQLNRYEQRTEINDRIDAAQADTATPLVRQLSPPAAGAQVGPAPGPDQGWAMATAEGRYDPAHEVLVRGRTVEGQVGVEVLTPLLLADGAAVLVNRGWVPPAATGASARPDIPPPPGGEVTVAGRIRPSEREGDVEAREGALHTRRIGIEAIAAELPYPVYGGYLLLDSQQPPAEAGLTPVAPRRENSWLNAGYAVQWWIFAGLVLIGYGWLARREAHRAPTGAGPRSPES